MSYPHLHLMDHPLIQHKISVLRAGQTSTRDFRRLVHEIALLIGYEATRDLKLDTRSIQTPLQETQGYTLANPVCLVPVLRAGLGMTEAMLELFPTARVGHIGLYRDHETLAPIEYYCKLPTDIADCDVFILDPMLATGGSALAAIACLKKHGVRNLRLLNLVAAPEGVNAIHNAYTDVEIYLGALDEKLNENGYILPGLGDAGDRLFGTL